MSCNIDKLVLHFNVSLWLCIQFCLFPKGFKNNSIRGGNGFIIWVCCFAPAWYGSSRLSSLSSHVITSPLSTIRIVIFVSKLLSAILMSTCGTAVFRLFVVSSILSPYGISSLTFAPLRVASVKSSARASFRPIANVLEVASLILLLLLILWYL